MSTSSRFRILALAAAAFSLAGLTALASAAPPASTNPPASAAAPGSGARRANGGIQILTTKDLGDIPGKQALMLTLEIPPGAKSSPPHRHDAHVFVYVLDGIFVTQIRGRKKLTLRKGQWFYEGPQDIHEVSANGSATRPLKLLIFMIKDKNKPATMPAAGP